jgi:hypothetical protein
MKSDCAWAEHLPEKKKQAKLKLHASSDNNKD